ncbi:MAG TPA: pyridoxamine 5'-phosphate oxidase family protein [Acidimicrobiia bacterium]|nr:pyridoxamine 5'-phosphate oxidase family protein [Acidimicrobiia bacterium]
MHLTDERTGLEYIPRDECLELLRLRSLGRIGVVVAGRPVVLPINYTVDGGSIVFRTDVGTKFDAAVRGEFVAFEIDDADPNYHTGWSVLLTGVAEEIIDAEERRRAEMLPLRPWAPGAKSHYLRITPVTISGRRIAEPAADS